MAARPRGYEGIYAVSSRGRVKSLPGPRRTDRVLRQSTSRGYAIVSLSRNGVMRTHKVHQLVLLAFVGPRPEGAATRHLDGDRLNNAVENLQWGTYTENAQDILQHGRNWNANKTACKNGHPYDEANTAYNSRGRRCRACGRESSRRAKEALQARIAARIAARENRPYMPFTESET